MWFNRGSGGSGFSTAAALCERALADDDSAAVELLNRLSAGDSQLLGYVAQPNDDQAAHVREAVVAYLARGRWQGRTLSLPAGAHAGRAGHQLRDQIMKSALQGTASGWEQTLLTLVRGPDAVVRETSIHLLEGSHSPQVIAALLTSLHDPDERVRWAAAIELARTGRPGAEGVLRALVTRDVTPESRHVMAYVLRRTSDESIRQHSAAVVEALDSADYRVSAPLAANHVLATMSGGGQA
jgi:HEAT repeat protein